MIIGITFIIIALILYTVAVWTERILKKLKIWIIFTFGSGFVCDLIGTSIMFFTAKEKFALHLHTICGYSALVIMFLHLIWAILSHKYPKCEIYFTRFSIIAWSIWLLAFISGIILKSNGL